MGLTEILNSPVAPWMIGAVFLSGGFISCGLLWVIYQQNETTRQILAEAKCERDLDRQDRHVDREHREGMVRVCHTHHEKWVSEIRPVLVEANGHMVACRKVAEDNMRVVDKLMVLLNSK